MAPNVDIADQGCRDAKKVKNHCSYPCIVNLNPFGEGNDNSFVILFERIIFLGKKSLWAFLAISFKYKNPLLSLLGPDKI